MLEWHSQELWAERKSTGSNQEEHIPSAPPAFEFPSSTPIGRDQQRIAGKAEKWFPGFLPEHQKAGNKRVEWAERQLITHTSPSIYCCFWSSSGLGDGEGREAESPHLTDTGIRVPCSLWISKVFEADSFSHGMLSCVLWVTYFLTLSLLIFFDLNECTVFWKLLTYYPLLPRKAVSSSSSCCN